ncbi:hypothetical protein Tco_0562804, partial [Tanacetum coccineum]
MPPRKAPKTRTTSSTLAATTSPATTYVTNGQLKAMIDQGVASTLAARDAKMAMTTMFQEQ